MSIEQVSMDDLKHHGVKGMHWGSRKSSSSGGGSAPPRAKVSTVQIKEARKRFGRKAEDYHDSMKALKKTTERGSKAREAGMKKLEKTKVSLLKDPDRATSLLMTKGEKAATAAVAASPFVLITPGGILITASAGAGAAARVVTRKVIEKKQATGAYDQKK